jgi:hypothetical protein
MSFCLVRHSFFKGCHQRRIGLSHLWPGLTQTKVHLLEDALTLMHTESDLVALLEMRRQQLAVSQVSNMTEIRGIAAQVASQSRPLLGIQASRSSRALAITHSLKSLLLKAFDPALHGATVFAKKSCNLLATVATSQKQQTVQSVVVPGFIRAEIFLLNRDSHDLWIGNFELTHVHSLNTIRSPYWKIFMRHYLCRYV